MTKLVIEKKEYNLGKIRLVKKSVWVKVDDSKTGYHFAVFFLILIDLFSVSVIKEYFGVLILVNLFIIFIVIAQWLGNYEHDTWFEAKK